MSYQAYKDIILNIARTSIENGLQHHKPITPDAKDVPDCLLDQAASFVTLELNHQLRGCIGSLEAYRPLVTDIAFNAYAAAFNDPRFPPLSAPEFSQLHIEVSILDAPQTMTFTDETDFLNQLKPGIDGLILEDQGKRATFLPSVWESLPDKEEFLSHLKLKAGLPENHWSDNMVIYRYSTEKISENN